MKIYLAGKLLLLLIFAVAAVALPAVTRTVDINGTGQYTAIQSAINAAVIGDTILVYPGRYVENVNINKNNISLISLEYSTHNPAFIDSTIIDGNRTNRCIYVIQNIVGTYIRGFTLTNGRRTNGGGVLLSSSTNSQLINCDVYGNEAETGAGVYAFEGSLFLSGVKIHDNYAIANGGGFCVDDYHNLAVITFDAVNRCSIYNNRSGMVQDIMLFSYRHVLDVYLDTFSVVNPISYYVSKNPWYNEVYALNVYFQNVHHQEVNNDLYVSVNGDDTNDGLSPATPLKTIHTAIYRIAADSLSQKTVHILPGTYSRELNNQLIPIALKSWVRVEGAGSDSVFIIATEDAQISTLPLQVFSSYSTEHASLAGVDITARNSDDACALYAKEANYLTLYDVRIHDMTPHNEGLIDIYYARHVLFDRLVIENFSTTNYGFMSSGGRFSGTIRNSIFRNATNTYASEEGWALMLCCLALTEDFTLENCIFDNLTMLDDDSSTMQCSNVTSSIPLHNRIINCQFTNFHNNYIPIYFTGGVNITTEITNCTFAGTTSSFYPLTLMGNITVTNCIFFDDTPHEMAISGTTSSLTVRNSCIRGGNSGLVYVGSGGSIVYENTNINQDPLFIGGDVNNLYRYRLSSLSPCINAGLADTTGLYLPLTDLQGSNRIIGTAIDMGGYEYDPAQGIDNQTPLPTAKLKLQAYPNPFSTSTKLSFFLPEAGDTKLTIYNVKGQRVRTLLSSPLKKGYNSTEWDGMDDNGKAMASGIYFAKINSKGRSVVHKVMVVK